MSKEIEKMTAIYEKHKNTMYAVALKILKNPQDAEDAVHNTIPSIMRNLDAIKDVDSKDCIYYVTMAVKRPCGQNPGQGTVRSVLICVCILLGSSREETA